MKIALLLLPLIPLAGCQSTDSKMTVIHPSISYSEGENQQPLRWVKKDNVFYLELHHSQ